MNLIKILIVFIMIYLYPPGCVVQ